MKLNLNYWFVGHLSLTQQQQQIWKESHLLIPTAYSVRKKDMQQYLFSHPSFVLSLDQPFFSNPL
jgi:hypothetical protein